VVLRFAAVVVVVLAALTMQPRPSLRAVLAGVPVFMSAAVVALSAPMVQPQPTAATEATATAQWVALAVAVAVLR
jgi:hypothetical protein